MPLTPYVEAKILKHIFWQEGYSPMIPFYLGLGNPSHQELTGQPGYARVQLASGAFGLAANGIIANAVTIIFPTATADWSEEIGYWMLFDDEDNEIEYSILHAEYPVKKWDVPMFDVGVLEVEMPNSLGASEHYAWSDYLKDKMLNHIFYKEDYPSPDALWVGLLTANPGDELTNTACNEVPWAGTSYLRIPTAKPWWEIDMTQAWNKVVLTFPYAEENWGIVNHFALFDVWSPTTEGNALLHGPVDPAKNVTVGSRPRFDITVPNGGYRPTFTTLGLFFELL